MADLRGVPLGGTVALRRRASSPCLKVGTQAPQTPWRTVTSRAFECLLRGFWAGEWITSGDPNAQCNSATLPALFSRRGASGTRETGLFSGQDPPRPTARLALDDHQLSRGRRGQWQRCPEARKFQVLQPPVRPSVAVAVPD